MRFTWDLRRANSVPHEASDRQRPLAPATLRPGSSGTQARRSATTLPHEGPGPRPAAGQRPGRARPRGTRPGSAV